MKHLFEGSHPIEASLHPERNAKALKERIDLGYVSIKFTDTRGETELGLRLDPSAMDTSGANFENSSGVVHLEGGLTLNYVKVRCIADVNLETLQGNGHLVPVGA